MKKFLITALGALALTGCARPISHYTVMSTNDMNLHAGHYYLGPKVKGEDLKYIALVPLGLPMIEDAVKDAVSKDPCAVGLVDGDILTNKVELVLGFETYQTEGYLLLDADKEGCSYLKDHNEAL